MAWEESGGGLSPYALGETLFLPPNKRNGSESSLPIDCVGRGSYENTWGQSAMGPWRFQEQVLAALERSLGVVQGSVAVPGRTALEWKRGWRHKAYLRTRGLREPAGTKGVGASLGECIWLMWPEPHVGVTGRKTKQRCTASRHTSPKTPPHKTL